MVVKEFLEEIEDDEVRSFATKLWKGVKYGATGIFALLTLGSSVYTVKNNSVGVVQRFGAYTRESGPGLNFKIPWIEKVTKVPTQEARTEEFGFRTREHGINSSYITTKEIADGQVDQKDLENIIRSAGYDPLRSTNLAKDAERILREEYLMLTGDLNMADVDWTVQYDIKDPKAYLFNVKDPTATLRDCSRAVVSQLIGNGSVDEAINIGRVDYENEGKVQLQKLLDSYETGINVIFLKFQSTTAPARVAPAFKSVNDAITDKETRISAAMTEYNKVVPKATGEAQNEVENAKGYATSRINNAKGDVAWFNSMLVEYRQSPDITRKRLLYESMERILPRIEEKWYVDGKGLVQLLNLAGQETPVGKK